MGVCMGGGEKEKETAEGCTTCKYCMVKFNRNKGIIVLSLSVKANIYFMLKI